MWLPAGNVFRETTFAHTLYLTSPFPAHYILGFTEQPSSFMSKDTGAAVDKGKRGGGLHIHFSFLMC